MHKLLFAVVHLLLDKASCYTLDKSEETPFASKIREYRRVASRNRVSDHFSADVEQSPSVRFSSWKLTRNPRRPLFEICHNNGTQYTQIHSLSQASFNYYCHCGAAIIHHLLWKPLFLLLAIREELRDLLKLGKSCKEMQIQPNVGLERVKGFSPDFKFPSTVTYLSRRCPSPIVQGDRYISYPRRPRTSFKLGSCCA
jgi:hypothetical protein